ncbi:hypothetical protein FO519_007821 [Halicephalobus sp. NKZ332]|nr:hypothetical protein FO519_007821 [Halicephalobus sp. NKZ332]
MMKIGYTVDNIFDPDHEDFYMLCFHIHTWMKIVCVVLGLLVILGTVELILFEVIDFINVAAIVGVYLTYICMLVGIFAWKNYYKLLNIYLFYMGIRIITEFGFLGEVISAAVIASKRKSDLVNGEAFEKQALYSLYDAVLAAISMFAFIWSFFIVYIEYKYLKGKVYNGLT